MSGDDFRDLTFEFDNSGLVNVTFERWDGATLDNGIATDLGFSPLVIVPPFVYVPRAPKDHLERLDVGDRERGACLLWSDAFDAAGDPLNTLRTIAQVGRQRADRLIDVDRGLTYIMATQWDYGRQAMISGALGVLLDAS